MCSFSPSLQKRSGVFLPAIVTVSISSSAASSVISLTSSKSVSKLVVTTPETRSASKSSVTSRSMWRTSALRSGA